MYILGKEVSAKKTIIGIVGLVMFLILISVANQIFETNIQTEYQIKQAAVSGTVSIRNEPGMYLQNFGTIWTYQKADEFYFSKSKLDGGSGAESAPLNATFQGNSTAKIGGYIKFRFPVDFKNQIRLHTEYGSVDGVVMNLVRNAVDEALKQTGPMFTPEEAYIDRRPEFTATARSILEQGLFATITTVVDRKNADGSISKVKITRVKKDSNDLPIISKTSTLKDFGIFITQFVIKDFDFDPDTDKLIQTKKLAEQNEVASRASAREAKQLKITTEEKGKANVAKAKYEELEKKIRAVTTAEKEKQVATLKSEQELIVATNSKLASFEMAEQTRALGKAEAFAAQLKVKAGLTPQEKAEWDFKTKVGVAEQLSKAKMPSIVMGGGNGKSNSGPLDAIGIKFLLDINQQLSKEK